MGAAHTHTHTHVRTCLKVMTKTFVIALARILVQCCVHAAANDDDACLCVCAYALMGCVCVWVRERRTYPSAIPIAACWAHENRLNGLNTDTTTTTECLARLAAERQLTHTHTNPSIQRPESSVWHVYFERRRGVHVCVFVLMVL